MPRPYQLTAQIVTSSVGTGVRCLSDDGLGRVYQLYAARPGPARNRHLGASGADLSASATYVAALIGPVLVRVDIQGPIEQRAGYHDPCGGWSDGNDAIADRLCAAFAEGDVLLVVDTPGGAAAGVQQGVARAAAAKARFGRRCTVYADEMIGSLGVWWAMAVGDEVFLPAMGKIGSIGARARHTSIAGALAKEGVEVTDFADPPEKVALAPEQPLGEVGRARGNRDVTLAADDFRAAVCASPVGLRYGLTTEGLKELKADMLTGQAAVDAGLADGVAMLEDVTAYALKLAESTKTSTGAKARGDSSMRDRTNKSGAPIRAESNPEGDDEEDVGEGEPKSIPGEEIPTVCEACKESNPSDAKFCKGCGTAMESSPKPGEDAARSGPAALTVRPARLSPAASFAEVLGLPPDASMPAQKTAMLDMRQVYDFASQLTGQRTSAGILGGLTALSADAAESGRLRKSLSSIKATQTRVERWDLAKRLVHCNAPGWERGKVYEDVVTEAGERQLDERGKPLLRLSPVVAEMKLGTLRGMVEGFERNAVPANPFEPDREAAAAASSGAPVHGDKAARIERAKKLPKVVAMANRPGQTLTLAQLATSFVEQNFDL